MKPRKSSSQEPPIPTQDESRRANVLMEQMLSKFDSFGEALSDVRERVSRMEPDLHELKEDVTVLKAAVRTHTEVIRAQGESISSLKEAVQSNTDAIHSMQNDLQNINLRLVVVETKVA